MNSEKVKEIKDRLQEKLDYGLKRNGIASPLVSVELLNTTLIIIEELEASNKTKYDAMVTLFKEQELYKKRSEILKDENERLLEQRNKTYNIWAKDTEKIKDRIAELEKALEKEQINNLNCDTDLQYKEKRIAELEKEVETRKEEVLHLQEYGKKLIRETELKQFAERLKKKAYPFPCAIGVEYAIPHCKVDETLKECLCDNNQ